MSGRVLSTGFLAIVVGFFSFAVPSVGAEEEYDPFEKTNRKIFAFNDYLDRNFFVPVAKGYNAVTPVVIDTGITNMYQTALDPLTSVNSVAQLKFKRAATAVGRFVVNSTVGFFGFFDVATHIGLPKHREDFGQTLGYWGVGNGPYLVLPFFGPRTLRHSVGHVGDYYTGLSYTYFGDNVGEDAMMLGLKALDLRSDLVDSEQFITGDRYLFIRSAYLQNREYLANDGEVQDEFDDEFGIFEDEF
ncbi:MAG: VacJ family lipoprotein [Pseudomonadota bacterium]|nr:VacJ family lipoprotein [Pseudomonadota bacterium]MEC8102241.1 VacJ family lipoprotein [Pseudomonadota bacterium]